MEIPFERERRFPLEYRGVRVGDYIPDLIVAGTVVVEVKSVHHLEPVFTAQVITYLRITKLRVGLISEFQRSKTDRRPQTRRAYEHQPGTQQRTRHGALAKRLRVSAPPRRASVAGRGGLHGGHSRAEGLPVYSAIGRRAARLTL